MKIIEGGFCDIWVHMGAFSFNRTKVQKNRQNEKEILKILADRFY
jgi:hypothetical protein